MPFKAVEIYFPEGVEITDKQQRRLVAVANEICADYEVTHPGRTMWPFGIGFKPTFIPMTAEQESERGMEFDDGTFQIECHERADYRWKCAKCGLPQGDHKEHITEPPAGDCEFIVANG